MAEQLDDHRRVREPAVDAHDPAAGAGEHLLGDRSREAGADEQVKELALQPTVPATDDVAAVEDVDQGR